MPVFRYEAVNSAGTTITGNRQADIVQEVEQWLQKNSLIPIAIEISEEKETNGDEAYPGQQIGWLEKLKSIRIEEIILLCRQLSTLLGAGVDLLKGLTILSRQITHPRLRQIIIEVSYAIEQGSSLSEAFSSYPNVFNPLFINIVHIGEESGNMDKSFHYLADLYENEKSIREKIKMATRYPKIVIIALSCAVFFLMSFVIPKFITLFDKAKVALPLPTRILIRTSNFFSDNVLLLILAAAALVIAYRFALNYRQFVMTRDRLRLRVPVLGKLSIKIYMSRFCRVFSLLSRSGINIIHTLQLSTAALDNLVLVSILNEVREEVEKGTDINQALASQPYFPEMVVQMVAVGEETGQMDEMMARVADYFEVETDYTIKNLSTLIEPLLLLVMGVMVGFIALAIFTPMWDMMSVARGG